MSFKKGIVGLAAFAAAALAGAAGALAGKVGAPENWQWALQDAATPVMERMIGFHDVLLIISAAIVVLVLVLLVIVVVRFNARANPTPKTFTHASLLEIIWTGVPVIILIVIAVPSFKLLYYQDRTPEADMTIKAIGNQWFWSYEYPDHGDLYFDAIMLEDDELAEGQPRMLATDYNVVVPVDTTVRVLVTANDVIHAWAMPSFGVKIDAVPGRMNETWFRANEEGIYYGMCSELCGVLHGFMPIAVEVVSQEAFAEWLVWAEEEFGAWEPGDVTIDIAQAAAEN